MLTKIGLPNLDTTIQSAVTDVIARDLGPSVDTYPTRDDLPLLGVDPGYLAYVIENNRMYLRTDTGWYNIALINTDPTITTGPNPTYQFDTEGTPIVISLEANDPEGIPITWSYQVTSGTLGNTATITQNGGEFTITPSTNEADAGTFGITFTASDGVNIDTASSQFTLQFASPIGQQAYTTPGTYSWTAPDGVTSVCVVCVGGGGIAFNSGTNNQQASGGGAGLGWKNNIPVVPGQSYTVVVGAGGTQSGLGGTTTNGQDSYFIAANSNDYATGKGGRSATNGAGGLGGGYYGDGGGSGGNGLARGSGFNPGGGGAGGYSGNGGAGSQSNTGIGNPGAANSGAAGGGDTGRGGGGVGIHGKGATGTAQYGANGGSGGGNGGNTVGNAGSYGGGNAAHYNQYYPASAGGAVRIIWGDNRAFPSTNTQDIV